MKRLDEVEQELTLIEVRGAKKLELEVRRAMEIQEKLHQQIAPFINALGEEWIKDIKIKYIGGK